MIPATRITSPARFESAAPLPRLPVATGARRPLSLGVAAGAEAELDGVTELLAGLLELPVSSWLAIGRELMADRDGLAVRQSARGQVEEAIGAHNLALVAWSVRDAVETVVCLVSRRKPWWSPNERCQLAAAHAAAEDFALALRARAHVRPVIVRILTSAFAPFRHGSTL